MTDPAEALKAACDDLQIDCRDAVLLRQGENSLYRLPGAIVARVTRPGQYWVAEKEIRVSQWLRSEEFPVIETVPSITQPIAVPDGRAVTFWRELPSHSEGTIAQLAQLLRRLHSLTPPPLLNLPELAPFTRLRERVSEAIFLSKNDRSWLLEHLKELEESFGSAPVGMPECAIHGDAWGGNIVNVSGSPIMLDLERFASGPPEWDLVSIAVSNTTFGALSNKAWETFCDEYGQDVTDWPGFELFRDARELRKVTFAAQMASMHPHFEPEARYRLACIRGAQGPRPWNWKPVP